VVSSVANESVGFYLHADRTLVFPSLFCLVRVILPSVCRLRTCGIYHVLSVVCGVTSVISRKPCAVYLSYTCFRFQLSVYSTRMLDYMFTLSSARTINKKGPGAIVGCLEHVKRFGMLLSNPGMQ